MTTQVFFLLALIIAGLISILLINKLIFDKIKKEVAAESELLSGIFQAANIFSALILLSEIITPLQTILHFHKNLSNSFNAYLMYISMFFGVALAAYFAVYFFSSIIFSMVTKTKSIIDSIKSGRLSDLLIYTAILLGLTILIKDGIPVLMDYLIEYPTFRAK